MSGHGFISVFAAELDAYVEFKKSMGFSGASRVWYLKQFDAYCAEHDRVLFDQATVEGWVAARLATSGRYRSWMSYIRGFGRWLRANGASDAYVLSEAWKAPCVPARPYLLSRQEIDLFFKTAGALEVCSPWRWQAAAFFTLMHSCGLRTGEVRALQADQVNLDDGHIDVVWSKGNRSRRLPLTGQVIEVLDVCDRASSARFASRKTFFVSAAGTAVTPAAVGVTFGRIWDQAGLARPDRRPSAPAIRLPAPFRLCQYRTMDEPGQRCHCDAALSVALHGACDFCQHLLLHSYLSRLHGLLRRAHPEKPIAIAGSRIRMRRDPKTDAPDLFGFARDYLHAYMPKVRGLSPKTIEAYRISLECFLDYLADTGHVAREQVSFDHFDRNHLKSWLAWMTDQQHYAPKTVTLRLSAIKAFLAYASHEDITLVALSQAAKTLKAPRSPRTPIAYLSEPETRAILAAFSGQTAKSRRNRMLLILLYDTAARVSEITGLTLQDLSPDQPRPCHPHRQGKQNSHRPADRQDDRSSARLPRRVPPQHSKTPRNQAGVLQRPPRTASRVVSRHSLRRFEASCPDRPNGLPVDPGEDPLPHAAQDQSDGPLPRRHPAADHHAPPGSRERLDHRGVLRLRDPRHDATSNQRSDPRH